MPKFKRKGGGGSITAALKKGPIVAPMESKGMDEPQMPRMPRRSVEGMRKSMQGK